MNAPTLTSPTTQPDADSHAWTPKLTAVATVVGVCLALWAMGSWIAVFALPTSVFLVGAVWALSAARSERHGGAVALGAVAGFIVFLLTVMFWAATHT